MELEMKGVVVLMVKLTLRY